MSIIDNLLILVEDSKKISLDDVCKKMSKNKRQIIGSALGRLAAKGYIDKSIANKITTFKINSRGHNYIDTILDNIVYLHNNEDQNKTNSEWHIVIFNIPEKKRKLRDELRRTLSSLGFGRLHDSTWFSQIDRRSQIQKIANQLGIMDNIIFIQSKKFSSEDHKKLLDKLIWDWKILDKNVALFIDNAEQFLKSKNKLSYQAKALVFEFARIAKSDPKIAFRYYPENYKITKALKLYTKVRPFCYN